MPLCECEGSTTVEMLGTFERCELTGNRHTSFTVHKCSTCQGIGGFPTDNFKLGLDQGTDKSKQILNEIIDSTRVKEKK